MSGLLDHRGLPEASYGDFLSGHHEEEMAGALPSHKQQAGIGPVEDVERTSLATVSVGEEHHEEEMAGALPSHKQQAGIGPVEDVERTSLATVSVGEEHHEEEMAGALPSQKQQAGIGPVEDVERTSLATVSVGEEHREKEMAGSLPSHKQQAGIGPVEDVERTSLATVSVGEEHHEEEMAGALPSHKQQAGIGPVEDVERTSLATVSVGEEHHVEELAGALPDQQLAATQPEKHVLLQPLSAVSAGEEHCAETVARCDDVGPVCFDREHVVNGDSGTSIQCQIEAAVAEAVSSRLESLESEVRLLSSELVRCRELVIQFSATEKAAFQEKFDAVQLQFQTSSSYFDQKLEDSMRQLKEHVRLSKTLMNSWCRGAAARVANCEEMVSKAALQPVSTVSTEQDAVLNAVMGRIEQEKVEREAEMLLMKRDLNELRGACALRRPVKSAKTRSPSRRIQNASPRNRPLCRRQGWASASFRALSSPVTHQENHTLSASVDFASEEKRGSQVDLGNPQDLVQQVSELQREPLRAETGKTGVEPLGQARNSWSPSSTFSP
ncbi:unnamed protein product [Symbiodinium pilosum]|uniref:Uncharacterized protein n=1 Tax=Symbiodinium pilosum TaxID=2952 RepID=A0A812TP69_SYMPI|nr:unnamed protein product [Symbiodinium pilosum]